MNKEESRVVTDFYQVGKIERTLPATEQDPLLSAHTLGTAIVHLKDGRTIEAQYTDDQNTNSDDLHTNDRVIVLETNAFVGDTPRFVITDQYRLPSVGFLLASFFCAIIFAGRKGFTSIIGLGISLAILAFYTVPSIMNGAPPFTVAIISSFGIAFLSLTVAHGFNKKTALALISTLITLTLAVILSQIFVTLAKLTGGGSEEAYFLAFAGLENINLQGLLLAGIMIGVMGVLDDVTTAQTASVEQLAQAGVTDRKKLFLAGSKIGGEHIISLVNTLALAYAGASLPLLLMFSLNEGEIPTWVMLNGELITEEIVRTLVGSTTLILAVPISTLIATYAFGTRHQNISPPSNHTA